MTTMTTRHFSEADLLETYYMQPGESMPVMMHLASCRDCAGRYDRLERKLREAATCSTSEAKPETFWTRQRMSVMRKIGTRQQHTSHVLRVTRVAAAAVLAFLLGGIMVYKSVEPKMDHQAATVITHTHAAPNAPAAKANDDLQVPRDPWQSDELKDFHNVVQWESWVADSRTTDGEDSL